MPDPILQFEYMSLDDFEELLLDKPESEKWELIGGRIIRGMVGARWEHKQIILNLTLAINNLCMVNWQSSRCGNLIKSSAVSLPTDIIQPGL
ncbi:MAG: hypothetical protein GY938_12040 [Ketobacter sp.]|nr:hypothetical protein [Ketobacter sp.]